MAKLTDMTNIGVALSNKLVKVGITSSEELLEQGANQTFLKLKAEYPDVCINHLYAITGAVEGIRWGQLSEDKKQEVREFYNSFK